MLDLDDGAGDQISLVKGGDGAVDELVHLLIGHVVQGEDGRVLNLTQRWTPFGNGAPITMMAAWALGIVPGRGWKRTCFSGANRYGCMDTLFMRS